MKHLLTILSGLLVALLFARCADDDNLSGGIDGLPERGIVIRLSTGELDTRTQLTSTGDYHHVEEVWAVLYKWNGKESADPTTDPNNHGNYDYVSATRLNLENGTPWNPYDASTQSRPNRDEYSTDEAYDTALDEYLENMQTNYGGEYGNGKVQGREFVLPETNDMTNGTYRVLCIGFDEASKTCYGLQNGSSLTLSGTLAEAYAKLSNKEFGGELFAGWTEFEFEPDNINIAEVELKRRVAGVLCYVNDIPTTITEAGETYNINTIRLCLNTKANDAIHLCRLDDRTKDFGTSNGIFTEEKTILAEYKIPEEIIKKHQGEVQGQGKEIFEGNLGQFEDTNVRIKEGSVLLGAYLIPIKHVEGKATLSVELLDANGTVAKTFNAVRSDDPDGELTDESGATIDSQNTTSYDILPNYIYHIGNKDDDTDEPMSLLGQKITVVPKKWTGETIPVEFPSVPIKPRVEVEGIPEGRILDCIGREITIVVTNSVLKEDWVLHSDGGIYFPTGNVSGENISCTNKYSATADDLLLSEVRIPAILTDYAKITNLPIEDDHRTIRLSVMVGSEEKAFVEFKQYNAIIVEMYDEDDERDVNLAFSRFDWNQQHIDEASARQRWPWGYYNSSPSNIYANSYSSEDGRENYLSAKDGRAAEGSWDGSAIYRCARYGYQAETATSGIVIKKKEAGWYLPAYNELNAFLMAAGTAKKNSQSFDAYNVVVGTKNNDNYDKYWSSNPVAGRNQYSWCYWLEETGNVVYDNNIAGGNDNNHRRREYYMRNCSRDVEPAN